MNKDDLNENNESFIEKVVKFPIDTVFSLANTITNIFSEKPKIIINESINDISSMNGGHTNNFTSKYLMEVSKVKSNALNGLLNHNENDIFNMNIRSENKSISAYINNKQNENKIIKNNFIEEIKNERNEHEKNNFFRKDNIIQNEAIRQLKKKQFNEKIVKKLNVQLGIIDDQMMLIENTEVNKDIAGTIKAVNEKLKQLSAGIDINEIEKAVEDMQDLKEKNNEMNEEFGEAINNAVDEDPDIEDELNRLEAEMNNYPNANKEQLVSSKVKTNEIQPAEIPVGNLEFY